MEPENNLEDSLKKADKEDPSQKSQPPKQYWNENRITLIAYEVQFIYEQRPTVLENQPSQLSNDEVEKKKVRKKVDLKYQSGFLSVCPETSDTFDVKQLSNDYEQLHWLHNSKLSKDYEAVKEFIKIMLELKHSAIVRQFCEVYNFIVRELRKLNFEEIVKEEPRYQWLEGVRDRIIAFINEKKEDFSYLVQFLEKTPIETKKLILVEVYCLLAERFNFNINEFYCQAFSITMKNKASKRVKKDA